MSDFSEKLSGHRSTSGAARCSREQLGARWGRLSEVSPGLFRIEAMGNVEFWRVVIGRGASATLEQVRSENTNGPSAPTPEPHH